MDDALIEFVRALALPSPLQTRIAHGLTNEGIASIEQLTQCSAAALLRIPHLGTKAVAAMGAELAARGLAFADDPVGKPEPSRPGEWQPIETAPKDGTLIDLWLLGKRLPDCYFAVEKDAWWQRLNGSLARALVGSPTHWMPLPASPKGSASV